jgi:hypothetical protein
MKAVQPTGPHSTAQCNAGTFLASTGQIYAGDIRLETQFKSDIGPQIQATKYL